MVHQSQFIEMFGNDSIGNCKWPTKSFGELFEISSSRRILKDDWAQEGVPFLRVRDLIYYSQTGELKNEFFVSESFYNKLKDADGRVQEGDILVSATSTIGKCMVVKNGERYYYKDADVLRFREKAPVNKVFFVYGLSMPTVENQINDTIGKTTVGHFLISKAATIKQPLPPTQLQESFERIVKQADKSKFAGLKSQFIEMSKHGCSKRQLGSLFCSIRNGANIKQGVKSGGFPITRIETIAEGYVDRSKMGYAGIEDNSYSGYYLQNYDILMSHINSMKHIGKTAIYRQSIGETVIHGMNLLCLRLKEGVANPMYVLYLLQSDDIRTEIRLISKQAVNQASFTVSDLKTIEITLPSMSVQNQFEVVVNQADKSKYLR